MNGNWGLRRVEELVSTKRLARPFPRSEIDASPAFVRLATLNRCTAGLGWGSYLTTGAKQGRLPVGVTLSPVLVSILNGSSYGSIDPVRITTLRRTKRIYAVKNLRMVSSTNSIREGNLGWRYGEYGMGSGAAGGATSGGAAPPAPYVPSATSSTRRLAAAPRTETKLGYTPSESPVDGLNNELPPNERAELLNNLDQPLDGTEQTFGEYLARLKKGARLNVLKARDALPSELGSQI